MSAHSGTQDADPGRGAPAPAARPQPAPDSGGASADSGASAQIASASGGPIVSVDTDRLALGLPRVTSLAMVLARINGSLSSTMVRLAPALGSGDIADQLTQAFGSVDVSGSLGSLGRVLDGTAGNIYTMMRGYTGTEQANTLGALGGGAQSGDAAPGSEHAAGK